MTTKSRKGINFFDFWSRKSELSKKNYFETQLPSLNRGEIIGCTQKNITLQWVLDNYERIGIDSKELQRYLQDWTEDEQNEFITNVLFGYELKDTFQLIVLDKQIKWCEDRLESSINQSKKEQIKKDLAYFKYWRDEKKMIYLCIDGQHRLYYLHLLLTGQLLINIKEPEKPQWVFNGKIIELNGFYFNEYEDEIQEVIKNIELACIFWAKAPLLKFAFIFTSCNKGKSPHHHEMRSVFNRSDWGLFCSEILLDCPDRDRIWRDIIHLTNKISFKQKADTYYLASLFPFWYKESGYNTLSLVPKYDFVSTDFLYNLEYNIPKNILNEYYKDIKNVYTLIKQINPSKFTVCQFTNLLYYYIKFTKVGVGPEDQIYSIRKPLEFFNKFIDDESDRIDRDYYQIGQDGERLKDINGDFIIKEHRYESKNSTNTFANVKYRKEHMDQDIFKNVSDFEKSGIIQKRGNRDTGLTAEKIAYKNNYKDSKGKEIDRLALRSKDVKDKYVINENTPISQGGDRTIENSNLMKQKDNVHLYHTEQKFNERR